MSYPRSLKQFEFFSFLGLFLLILISYAFWDSPLPTYSHHGTVFEEFLRLAIPSSLFIVLTGRSRDKTMRVLCVVLFFYSFGDYFLEMPRMAINSHSYWRFTIVFPYLIIIYSLKKLFSEDSNDWFSRHDARWTELKLDLNLFIAETENVLSENFSDLRKVSICYLRKLFRFS